MALSLLKILHGLDYGFAVSSRAIAVPPLKRDLLAKPRGTCLLTNHSGVTATVKREGVRMREFLGYFLAILAIAVVIAGIWAARYYSPMRQTARLRARACRRRQDLAA